LAAHDGGEQPPALLLAAELCDRQPAQHDRRYNGHGRDGAADLLEQLAQSHEAEAAVADVLGPRDPAQSRLGELAPPVAIEALAAGLDLLQVLVRLAVGEDLVGEVARRLLLLGECEVHLSSASASPSACRDRTPRSGRAAPRSRRRRTSG